MTSLEQLRSGLGERYRIERELGTRAVLSPSGRRGAIRTADGTMLLEQPQE